MTALFVLAALWFQYGILQDGRCSICKMLGIRSTVTMNVFGSCTAMFCGSGHYDEDGNFVPPKPCNTCTRNGRCSNGHRLADFTKM